MADEELPLAAAIASNILARRFSFSASERLLEGVYGALENVA